MKLQLSHRSSQLNKLKGGGCFAKNSLCLIQRVRVRLKCLSCEACDKVRRGECIEGRCRRDSEGNGQRSKRLNSMEEFKSLPWLFQERKMSKFCRPHRKVASCHPKFKQGENRVCFSKFDNDKSGTIDLGEFEALIGHVVAQNVDPDDAENLLRRLILMEVVQSLSWRCCNMFFQASPSSPSRNCAKTTS